MINKVILMGRLTDKPELKKTQSGVTVTSFSIAVQRRFKGSDGNYITDFINIVAWKNTAEFITKYFDKGQLISIVGSIQIRPYEDKNGNKRKAFEVVADEAHFCGDKKESTDDISIAGEEISFVETDEELPF